MDTKRVLQLAVSILILGLYGCEQATSTVGSEDVIGHYRLRRGADAPDGYDDQLELQADGVYAQTVRRADTTLASARGNWSYRDGRVELVGWLDFVGFSDGLPRGARSTIAPQVVKNRTTGSVILLIDSTGNLFYAKTVQH